MSQTRYGDRRVSSPPLHRHPSPPAGPGPHPPRPDALVASLLTSSVPTAKSSDRKVGRPGNPSLGANLLRRVSHAPRSRNGSTSAPPAIAPPALSVFPAPAPGPSRAREAGRPPEPRLGRARPRGVRLQRGRGPRDPPAPRARAAGWAGDASAPDIPHGQRQPAPARPPGPSIASTAIRVLSSSHGTPHAAALTRDDEEPARWAIRRASVHAQPVASRPCPGADRAGLARRPRHGPPRDRPLRRWTSWRRRRPRAGGPAACRRRPRHRLPAGGAISGAAAPAGDSSARAKVSTSCASPVPISSSRASRHAWRRSSSPSAARITEMQ